MAIRDFHLWRSVTHHNVDWKHPCRFALRRLRIELAAAARGLGLSPGALVVDFGCATKPYQDIFPDGARYLGADLPGNKDADVFINSDGSVELENGAADVVLSTQVLEHVEDPNAYIAECVRLLKPGGHLLLTTHGLWRYHRDPIDLWRWTGDGLVHTVELQALKVQKLVGIVGLAAVGIQLFQDATYFKLPRALKPLYAGFMQTLVTLVDRLHKPGSRARDAMIYLVVAKKL